MGLFNKNKSVFDRQVSGNVQTKIFEVVVHCYSCFSDNQGKGSIASIFEIHNLCFCLLHINTEVILSTPDHKILHPQLVGKLSLWDISPATAAISCSVHTSMRVFFFL